MLPAPLAAIRGALFIVLCGLWLVLSCSFILFPLGLLLVLSSSMGIHTIARVLVRASSAITGFAYLFLASLFELLGCRIRCYTSPASLPLLLAPHGSSLILSNHPSTADWLFLFSLFHRLPCFKLGALKIIMKSALRSVPFLGWALQQGANLFMDRKIAHDKENIQRFVDYYCPISGQEENINVLLFPEGTDLRNEGGQANSLAYAAKNGLPVYRELLHPRTTGFAEMWSGVAKKTANNDHYNTIFDVTIAFPRSRLSKLDALVRGRFPEAIDFFIEVADAKALKGQDREKAEEWLKGVFAEKEQRLNKYYSRAAAGRRGPLYELANGRDAMEIKFPRCSWVRLSLYMANWLWLAFLFASVYGLATSLPLRIYLMCSIAFYWLANSRLHGIDRFVMNRATKGKHKKQE